MNEWIINLNNNKYIYKISDNLEIEIDVEKNHHNIPLKDLFQMAARENKLRSFLFVSKVLGKHIPINPKDGIEGGKILASMYIDELDSKTLFIGFCETATGLAQSVFRNFKGDTSYIHTTREEILNIAPAIEFLEEHSHAKSHKLYTFDENIIRSAERIVLIDDELTTGKTIINIIKQLNEKYGHNKFSVMTILDWRNEDSINEFQYLENKLGNKVAVYSLLKGQIKLNKDMKPNSENNINSKNKSEIENQSMKISKIWMNDFFDKEDYKENADGYIKYTGRFGISSEENIYLESILEKIGGFLKGKRKSKNSLIIGTKEFMYIPMFVGAHMGKGISFQSTTISPIYPLDREDYGAKTRIEFEDPYKQGQINYLYNIKKGFYEEAFLFFEREVHDFLRLNQLLSHLGELGIDDVKIIYFSENKNKFLSGSYSEDDALFLLKDLSKVDMEKETSYREKAIQSGVHYSEMLPIEYSPSREYVEFFHESLNKNKKKVALSVAIVSEKIIKKTGKEVVLVSLARAGTPVGILIKKYIKEKFNYDTPHYSVSIIRGKGLDKNAIKYIMERHPLKKIQFIDGWTGKGAIKKELIKSCKDLSYEFNYNLDSSLAVLSDTGNCTDLFGTREDFLIPSSCLNSTISGLMSRTIHREDLIDKEDFHGGKFYKDLIEEDLSNYYINIISSEFSKIISLKNQIFPEEHSNIIQWEGMKSVEKIGELFGIKDINLIKPGIGETTRVLLRRVPWKILIKNPENQNLNHIIILAKERDVVIEVFEDMYYECCGLIKEMEGE